MKSLPLLAGLVLAILLFWLEPPRLICALLVMLAWLALCFYSWLNWRSGRLPAASTNSLPVAYASQGGQARDIAERSAAQLVQAGLPAHAMPLEALDLKQPPPRLLLAASTYGDGEAPEHVARFARRLEQPGLNLHGMEYALLGLGDRQYSTFCAFAQRLDHALRARGASALFDRLEADALDPEVLRRWQQQLSQLAGNTEFSDWLPAAYQPWTLATRKHLNPGSQGAPLYHLQLLPPADGIQWQAGDIAEIGPRQSPAQVEALLSAIRLDGTTLLADGRTLADELSCRQLPEDPHSLHGLLPKQLLEQLPRLAHRDYSIASSPEDSHLELLVRLQQHTDGSLGVGSGWLCTHAETGACIDLRIRENPAFRLPADTGPLILIGNGSGLAGLRAHLRERERLGQHGHWLLFGERNAAHDFLLREELECWQHSGHLARLDLAFSRDQAEPVYVQHLLRDAADDLRNWLARGASLLVCGSLQGMGREVDALLHGLLGEVEVEELREAGRYRRDIY